MNRALLPLLAALVVFAVAQTQTLKGGKLAQALIFGGLVEW
jgi:hypothetical protein